MVTYGEELERKFKGCLFQLLHLLFLPRVVIGLYLIMFRNEFVNKMLKHYKGIAKLKVIDKQFLAFYLEGTFIRSPFRFV